MDVNENEVSSRKAEEDSRAVAKSNGGVVVIGNSNNRFGKPGTETDVNVIHVLGCVARMAIVGVTYFPSDESNDEISEHQEYSPDAIEREIDEAIEWLGGVDCVDVFKIGALFSVDGVRIVADALKRFKSAQVVLDVEVVFKTKLPTPPELVTAVREHILPLTTVLIGTVPEVKALLDDAGVDIGYPQNMEDVEKLGKSLRDIGPKYVVIKREMFDEASKKSTLHFLLATEAESVMAAYQFDNDRARMGLSYHLAPAIAANLAKKKDIELAVRGAFEFVKEASKTRDIF